MNNKTIPLDYVNSLMYELEKAFYDERGKGARFRMTTIGQQYFNDKVAPLLQSTQIDQIIKTVQDILQSEGIVSQVSYNTEDRLLRIQVKGCIHRFVEEKMNALEIEPFTCVPANLIVLAIEHKLNIPVELAEIKLEGDACKLLLVLFEKRPVLD
jgi:hypothetical protein